MKTEEIIIGTAFLCINLFAFVIAAMDKHRAIHGKWRISERTLLITALLGGCIGLYVSFIMFHHKIRKKKFMLGIPLIFLMQLILVIYLYSYL